jgi:hypothetical protein
LAVEQYRLKSPQRFIFAVKMGFEIANNSLQETCFIVAIVGLALAITATVLRFVATKFANRKPSWEDWFSVLATFFFILYVIPLLYRKLLLSLITFVLIISMLVDY